MKEIIRKRIEAEQAGSNAGAVLGLAIGAAMALTQDEAQTEEQTIQDEPDFNELLAQMKAEEEHTWQQSMETSHPRGRSHDLPSECRITPGLA